MAAAAFDLDPAPAMEAAAAVTESTAAVQETATALQEAAVAAGDAGDATPLLLFAGTALVLSSEMLKLVNTPRSGIDRTDALPSFGSLAANAAKSSQSPGERNALNIFYGGLANLEKDGFQHEFDGPPSALSNVATTTAVGEATTTTSTPFAPATIGHGDADGGGGGSMGKKPRMGAKELAKEAARRAAAAEAEKAAEAAAAEQRRSSSESGELLIKKDRVSGVYTLRVRVGARRVQSKPQSTTTALAGAAEWRLGTRARACSKAPACHFIFAHIGRHKQRRHPLHGPLVDSLAKNVSYLSHNSDLRVSLPCVDGFNRA